MSLGSALLDIQPVLGARMHTQGVVIRGSLDEEGWRRFLVKCAEALGMSPSGEARVWDYPIAGKGGEGMTIVQPITESFLALDTWSDHDGAYLFICSCRRFCLTQIVGVIREFGLGQEANSDLSVLRLK